MTPGPRVGGLKAQYRDGISAPVEFRGEFSITVPREKIAAICQYLKKECDFDMLTDLSGVDNYGEDPRYEVDYLLYSLKQRVRGGHDRGQCHQRLGHGELARARSVRHVRYPFPQSSEPQADPDVGRLPLLSVAKRFPAGRSSSGTARNGGECGHRALGAHAGRPVRGRERNSQFDSP